MAPGAPEASVEQAIGIGLLINPSCRIENNTVLTAGGGADADRNHQALVAIGFLAPGVEAQTVAIDQTASIRGNEFSGPASQALVTVPGLPIGPGSLIWWGYRTLRFSDNTCLRLPPGANPTSTGTVNISAIWLIVQGNNVETNQRPAFDLNNRVAIVLGNQERGGYLNDGNARPFRPGHFTFDDFNL